MKILEIITELKNIEANGFQLEKRNGILTSTWLLYKREAYFYYFDINQKIEFIDNYKYSEQELLEEFKNAYYTIDDTIS